jgi:two-component system response regulator
MKARSSLNVVMDGEEAMAFLHKKGKYADVRRPDLIFLDLNLPKKDGREVLAEIKSDAELRRIPVVVLTTSQAEEDIAKTYELGANCYCTKPIDLDSFLNLVQTVADFWLTTAKLPPR